MAAPPPFNLPNLKGITVLVIDDDDDSLEVLSAFFQACGAQALLARNAAGGLAYLDTAPKLDAVVTDLAMPNMDGIEFARRLRRHPSRKQLPVIAVTAFYETYPNAPEFDAWLRKPVDIEQLGILVGRLIRRAGKP
jgi:CheY-like chemotaxis protein